MLHCVCRGPFDFQTCGLSNLDDHFGLTAAGTCPEGVEESVANVEN